MPEWRRKIRATFFPRVMYSVDDGVGDDDTTPEQPTPTATAPRRSGGLFEYFMVIALIAAVIVATLQDPLDTTCETDRCRRIRIADLCLTFIFAIELVLHGLAFGLKKMRHPLRLVDAALVLVNVGLLISFLSGAQTDIGSLNVLRSVRLVRPLFTTTKLPSVRVLVVSIARCILELTDVTILFVMFLLWMSVAGLNQFGSVLDRRCVQAAGLSSINATQGQFVNFSLSDFECGGKLEVDVLRSTEQRSSFCSPSQTCTFERQAVGHDVAGQHDDIVGDDSYLKRVSRLGGAYICPFNYSCVDVQDPYRGVVGFNNAAQSFITVFVTVTLESFAQLSSWTKNATDSTAVAFFVIVIVLGSFVLVNLTIIIITVEFEKNRESERLRLRKEEDAVGGHGAWTFTKVVQELVRLGREERMRAAREGRAAHLTLESVAEHATTVATTSGRVKTDHPDADAEAPAEGPMSCMRYLHETCAWLSDTKVFHVTTSFIVVLNLVFLCSTYYGMPNAVADVFDVFNIVFTAAFSIEAVIHFLAAESFYKFVTDPTNVLDLFVIAVSYVEILAAGVELPVIRALRTVRCVKLLKYFPSLYRWIVLIASALKVAPVLFAVLSLIAIVMACLGMQVLGGRMCAVPVSASASPAAAEDLARRQLNRWVDYDLLVMAPTPQRNENDTIFHTGVNATSLQQLMLALETSSSPATRAAVPLRSYLSPSQSFCLKYFPDVQAMLAELDRNASFANYSRNLQSVPGIVRDSIVEMVSRTSFDSFSEGVVSSIIILLGDGWDIIMYQAMASKGSGIAVPFMIFYYVGNLVVVNLLIAIMLAAHADSDAVRNAEHADHDDKPEQTTHDEGDHAVTGRVDTNTMIEIGFDPERRARHRIPDAPRVPDRIDPVAAQLSSRSAWLVRLDNHRLSVQHFLENRYTTIFFAGVILLSCIELSLADPFMAPDTTQAKTLFIIDFIVTVVFCIEMLLIAYAYGFVLGKNTYLRRDWWNVIDFSLVVISVIGVVDEYVDDYSFPVLRILKVLRSLRPLRLARKSPGMKLVLSCIGRSIAPLRNISVISVVLFAMYAVIGVFFFGGKLRTCQLPSDLNRPSTPLPPPNASNYSFFSTAISTVPGTAVPLSNDDNTTNTQPDTIVPLNATQLYIEVVDAKIRGEKSLSNAECRALGGRYMNRGPHFDNVFAGMMALFQVSTLEMWSSVMYQVVDATEIESPPLRDANPSAAWYVIIMAILAGLLLMNLFSAALIDSYNRSKREKSMQPSLRTARQQDAWKLTEKRIVRRLLTDNQQGDAPLQTLIASKLERFVKSTPSAAPERGNQVETTTSPSPVHPSWYSAVRHNLRGFFHNPWTVHGIMFLVAFNFIVMASRSYPMSESSARAFDAVNIMFTVLFLLEMLLKGVAEGRVAFFQSRWNRADFFVTIISAVGMILQLSVNVRATSIFLSFRVVRLSRYLRGVFNIERLISNMRRAAGALLTVSAVCVLVFFIFAVVGMRLFGRVPLSNSQNGGLDMDFNFSRIDLAFITVFRVMIGGDWPQLLYGVILDDGFTCSDHLGNCGVDTPGPQLYFIALVFVTYLTMRHLITAVMLDSFASSALLTAITKDDAQTFGRIWGHYDTLHLGSISPFDVLFLIRALPVGCAVGFTRFKQRGRINQEFALLSDLHVVNLKERVPLKTVVDVLCRYSFEVDSPDDREFHQPSLDEAISQLPPSSLQQHVDRWNGPAGGATAPSVASMTHTQKQAAFLDLTVRNAAIILVNGAVARKRRAKRLLERQRIARDTKSNKAALDESVLGKAPDPEGTVTTDAASTDATSARPRGKSLRQRAATFFRIVPPPRRTVNLDELDELELPLMSPTNTPSTAASRTNPVSLAEQPFLSQRTSSSSRLVVVEEEDEEDGDELPDPSMNL